MKNNNFVGKHFLFDVKEWGSEFKEEKLDLDGMSGTIISLEIEISKSFEDNYWNIKFDNGIEISGVSGYHLELLD